MKKVSAERLKNHNVQRAKVPGNESSRERKFQGTNVPGNECSMELSFLGAKVPGNESWTGIRMTSPQRGLKLDNAESSTLWNFRSRERKFFVTKVPATDRTTTTSKRHC